MATAKRFLYILAKLCIQNYPIIMNNSHLKCYKAIKLKFNLFMNIRSPKHKVDEI